MITTQFAGCTIIARPDLGAVTISERRGDMAVIHTERGVTYICSVREPIPQYGSVDLPADCGEPA